jgi:hypothetical protein
MPALRFLASTLLCLYGGHASAAEESWELFATARTAKVYFDRGSVSKAEDFVQYRVRVEYANERETRERRYRYRSAVNGVAAQCEAKKVAVTSIALFDSAGARLTATSREPERWPAALNEVAGRQRRGKAHAACLRARAGREPAAA